jgi:hypothetical protein
MAEENKIELADVLKYQGITLGEKATIEDYKKIFDNDFVKIDQAADHPDVKKANAGEFTRKFATELKRTAKENNIDLSEDDTKKDVAELSRLVTAKLNEQWSSKYDELTAQQKKPNEAMTELQSRFDKLNLSLEDERKMKDDLAAKLTGKEKEFDEYKVSLEKSTAVGALHKSLKFSEVAKPLEIEGYHAHMNKNYKLEFDDKKTLQIYDTEGHRIADPSKHGAYLEPKAVYDMKAEEFNLTQKVDPNKVPNPKSSEDNSQQFNQQKSSEGVALNPRSAPSMKPRLKTS